MTSCCGFPTALAPSADSERVRTAGKFFQFGSAKWQLKGLTYGPFAPNDDGECFPRDEQLRTDFAHMRELGANTIRVYFPPPERFLDYAAEFDLRLLIDVPWEKHRCFFEDWQARETARRDIKDVARRLGRHPSVLAISVVNEFPNDIVRFYGGERVARFADELLDIVHQTAPECLATFANYPTTEFLQPRHIDFHSFNIYLHDPESLASYLDRLQHLAGSLPLVLSEHGVDSRSVGDDEQARRLRDQVRCAIQHGAAGNIVFAYTDDWFTGGHQIEDWCFGVTRRDRTEKPAAAAVRHVWSDAAADILPECDPPSVSVVVCSYNGARTLAECLTSLSRLNYPSVEILLVDDGSTDDTPIIAARFPAVRYIRQDNRGLSVARNVGAEAATGEIVAYTDDDCVVDEDWLLYLVRGLIDQDVDAIGGPNISPPSDAWTAQCVAASPGNPSHVMLDDRRAEHVPGCNMAFRRDVLLGLGGFDPRFRQAGDDVDICWRLLDEGRSIGFSAGAMVWHHRRCTVQTYLRQQKGYGRSESMVQFKHPHRFGRYGAPSFQGVIYGDGAVGLPIIPPRIYHGRFGAAPYQSIYRQQVYGMRAWLTSLEWHVLAAAVAVFSLLIPPLFVIPALMWGATTAVVMIAAREAPLPRNAPRWCRPLIGMLHLAQPVVRGWHRYAFRMSHSRVPTLRASEGSAEVKHISASVRDLYWDSTAGLGRSDLLEAILDAAAGFTWPGSHCSEWEPWDIALVGDGWHGITIRTATEELGWPRRFTRARVEVEPQAMARLSVSFVLVWIVVALATGTMWAAAGGALVAALLLVSLVRSRNSCLIASERLIRVAGRIAGFEAMVLRDEASDESSDSVEIPARATEVYQTA